MPWFLDILFHFLLSFFFSLLFHFGSFYGHIFKLRDSFLCSVWSPVTVFWSLSFLLCYFLEFLSAYLIISSSMLSTLSIILGVLIIGVLNSHSANYNIITVYESGSHAYSVFRICFFLLVCLVIFSWKPIWCSG
jgi:hypothetical protein